MTDWSQVKWQKGSRSSSNGQCVEVAVVIEGSSVAYCPD